MIRFIKKIIICVICLISIIALGVIGGYIYVRTTYDIDLFNTIKELRILSKDVDENELCPNAFNEEDYKKLKTRLDENYSGLILNKEGEIDNDYYIDFSVLESLGTLIKEDVSISEKEAGALSQMVFNEQTGGKLKLEDKEVSASIVQVDFIIIDENKTDFNVVVKLGLTSIKEEMNKFPLNLIKKYVPDYLYVSSTVKITKTNDEMEYNLAHVDLKLNLLSDEETEDLFNTIDKIVKIGTIEELNLKIGETAVNALIGNKDNAGFAYSLRTIGKTTFNFKTIDSIDYIVIS